MEKQNSKSNNNALEEAIEDLNIMLENNGIYKIKIEVNTNHRWQEVSAKVISTETTQDSLKNDVIKEVLKNGYCIEAIEAGDKPKIIKPAEVVIYKTEEKS